ncbi:response regulator [Mesorhizobium sp. B3-1-3]|uniref:response regulator n=1 Tax=unclassified Mesorhizobium TaxID=325217 RepID=UPI001128DD8E|nr:MULTISPECIES: response regulator [unclassified Mesorhizobium]TPI63426.1 response regulator [Mesorhizobium sp. B3-1-8]TPI72225.1 response regulator [Mesorhizobium sp. B3-1-3]
MSEEMVMQAPLALIIEDEYLIACDVADGLRALGFEVACVASERAAATWLDDNRPDLAIIDIQLLDGQRGTAAARLKEAGVPFVVHSGYDPAFQSAVFHGAPFLPKPAPIRHLVELASRLIGDRTTS